MIDKHLAELTVAAVKELFQTEVASANIQIQKTVKDFEGDLTVVIFPFVKIARKSPEQCGEIIGQYLQANSNFITGFNVVKGFLNVVIDEQYYLDFLNENKNINNFGYHAAIAEKPFVVEYSSPNTNKPLHLGHIRNNLLGWSVSEILKANGHPVKKVNLVNDRGIHICKSMVAWMRYGNGETPENSGLKGDHLVGKYYVEFDKAYKQEIKDLVSKNIPQEQAEKEAPILLEAQEMLRKWEQNDADVRALWEKMNNWVYAGFDVTYKRLGVDFDKIYYESNTYLLGKSMVLDGLQKGILNQRPDTSVWADLREDGLDEKLLLRADGTSVYMTQDLGTAKLRYEDFEAQKMMYIVGNEQNYHFDVLKIILKKLNYPFADTIEHVSYGMVELPEGKMKSREGTVVDADDLIQEMVNTARQKTEELGKIDNFESEEAQKLYETLALGALKYFILKVDPTKNMLFNPHESIDFNGNTGPFIQYTHARIRSLLNKSDIETEVLNTKMQAISMNEKEKSVLKLLHDFPQIVRQAGDLYSPALIANYIFELAKEFNSFYQDTPVLREENEELRKFRLALCAFTGQVLKSGLHLLGISAPEKM